LGPDCINWCQHALVTVGAPTTLKASLFLPQRPRIEYCIPPWYARLVELARDINGSPIRLAPLPHPSVANGWIIHPQVGQVLSGEFEDVDPDLLNDKDEEEEDIDDLIAYDAEDL
jgi:hypothetical protein